MKIILSVMMLSSGTAFSQQLQDSSAYIVAGADTIRGFFRYQNLESNPATIRFRTRETADWKVYTPRDISAFYVFGNAFESRTVEIDYSSKEVKDILANANQNMVVDTLVFLKVELKSESIALYKYFDKNNQFHYFIAKNGVNVQELRKKCRSVDHSISCRNEYWQTLRIHLSACAAISENEIKNTDLEATDLRKLVLKYVKCTTGNAQEKSSVQTGEQDFFSISVYAAPGITKLAFEGYMSSPDGKFTALMGSQFGNSFSFQGGAAFEYRPRLNPKLAFGFDVGVRHYRANSDVTVPYLASIFRQIFVFDLTYLKLSPSVAYYFATSGISPFVKAGFSYNYAVNFSSSFELQQTTSTGQVITTKEEGLKPYERSNYELGFFAAVGFKYAKLGVELRAERGTGMLGHYTIYDSKTQSLSLYLSYRIK